MSGMPIILVADLDIEKFPPRYIADGESVGSEPIGVKITHLPSGLTAISEKQSTLHLNQRVAMDMIVGGLTSQDLSVE
jgi:protein subunit release factor A